MELPTEDPGKAPALFESYGYASSRTHQCSSVKFWMQGATCVDTTSWCSEMLQPSTVDDLHKLLNTKYAERLVAQIEMAIINNRQQRH